MTGGVGNWSRLSAEPVLFRETGPRGACRSRPGRGQGGQLLASRARRSGFSPSEPLPRCFREGLAALLCYPCLPSGLASLPCVETSRAGRKKNQSTTHDFQQEKLCSLSGKREISAVEAEMPQVVSQLGGPKTPGLTGRCPARPQPTRCSVLASRLPPLLPITPREICWCPVLPGASSGLRQSRFPSAV